MIDLLMAVLGLALVWTGIVATALGTPDATADKITESGLSRLSKEQTKE